MNDGLCYSWPDCSGLGRGGLGYNWLAAGWGYSWLNYDGLGGGGGGGLAVRRMSPFVRRRPVLPRLRLRLPLRRQPSSLLIFLLRLQLRRLIAVVPPALRLLSTPLRHVASIDRCRACRSQWGGWGWVCPAVAVWWVEGRWISGGMGTGGGEWTC